MSHKRVLDYLLCSILRTQILIVHILAIDSFSSPPVCEANWVFDFLPNFISEVLVLRLIGLFVEHLVLKFLQRAGYLESGDFGQK